MDLDLDGDLGHREYRHVLHEEDIVTDNGIARS